MHCCWLHPALDSVCLPALAPKPPRHQPSSHSTHMRRLACCSSVSFGLTVLPCALSHLLTAQLSRGVARSRGTCVALGCQA